jgi:competence protein ComEA
VAGLTALAGLILGAALVAMVAVLLLSPSGGEIAVGVPFQALPAEAETAAGAGAAGPAHATELIVDVAGAVVRPGLHRLPTGARVGDALAAAGGYAPRADLAAASQALNLAQPLEDGAKVLVPELGLDQPMDGAPADDGRIDLNRAGQTELETLPGIGPVTARKIVDARGERRFGEVGELRSRGVVGQAVYDDIKDLVRVAR